MTALCLLDSNILIYYLNGEDSPTFIDTVEAAALAGSAISVITRIEVLGWRGHTETSRKLATHFILRLPELPLSGAVASRAIALRSAYPLKLGDAVIAATALESNLPLMTRNEADFSIVSQLSVINPFRSAR